MLLSGLIPDHFSIPLWLFKVADLLLVAMLLYLAMAIITDTRTKWMFRGIILLMLTIFIGEQLQLYLFSLVLEKLLIGGVVAMAVIFQSDFRRLLEDLGQGNLSQLLSPTRAYKPQSSDVIDEVVEAIKELSKNRTGALIVIETMGLVDERDFSVDGVQIDAEVSKELLQTIFQTTTLLHDGAVFIRGNRLVSAGIILPLSDRHTSRKLGTRHRAAMGITERIENCLCVVVSEETGSISLAELGGLNRPLTSSKLRELLEDRLSTSADREANNSGLQILRHNLGLRTNVMLKRLFRSPSSHKRK
jgi:uncharacterized protein (TIGR00159 family)